VDLYTCTHNHMDHTDPETLRRLRNKDTARFLEPMPCCATFRAFALPTDSSDLNHMGYTELLHDTARYEPDGHDDHVQ
jgi:L-ascorbate metabolism protein UlaG (beta-lactamase superfamily)